MTSLPALDHECFVISPIGKEGSPERERSDGVLEFVITRAATELGLTAVRADQIGKPGQITLQVIDHVLGAKAAVADLTGLNPNVFYELAIRHTARLPVALIVEKDSSLPFDIAQMRTIFFDHRDLRSADKCRKEIVSHLREALDEGAVDSPIATTLDIKQMQAGTTVERNIAEMITTLEEMSKAQRESNMLINKVVRSGSSRDGRVFALTLAQRVHELSQALKTNDQPPVAEAVAALERLSARNLTGWSRQYTPEMISLLRNDRGTSADDAVDTETVMTKADYARLFEDIDVFILRDELLRKSDE